MGFDITYPKINGKTDSEKLEQIRGYLYQLADQLKWALNTVNVGTTENAPVSQNTALMAQSTFNAVKALIINSADILNAYYNKLDSKFAENYVTKEYFIDSTKNLDFVTETGKSGNWQYQKYASGFVVAYGSFTANYQCNTLYGNGFYTNGTFALPSEMFTNIWNVTSSVVSSYGIRGISISNITNDAISALVYSADEDAAAVPLRIDLTVTGFKNTGG